jgi:hypothetical protein
MRHLLLIAIALMVGACAAERGGAPPKSPLAKALYFSELDHREHVHGLSQASVKSGGERAVERVPWGRPVDFESRVEIDLLDAKALAAQVVPGSAIDTTEVCNSLRVRRELIDLLPKIYEQRELAVRAYERAVLDSEFDAAIVPFLEAEGQALNLFDKLYPDVPESPDAAERLQLRRRMRADFDGAFSSTEGARKFSEALQREIDLVEQQLETTLAEVRRREARLRIEAFLSRGSDTSPPTALHVEGYDTIDEKRVASSDRFGLLLSETERAELIALLNDAKGIADALNRARASGASLSEALREVGSELARKLSDELTKFEALAETIRQRQTLLDDTKSALTAFLAESQAALNDAGDQALSDAVEIARTRLDALVKDSDYLARLLELIAETRAVRDLWRNSEGGDVLDAIAKSAALVERIDEFAADAPLTKLEAELSGGLKGLGDVLDAQLAQLAVGVRGALKQSFDTKLRPQLERWSALLASATDRLKFVGRLLGVAPQLKPVPLDVQAPNVIDVPVHDAPDTFIALKGSTARVGDTLEVRASLLVDGKVESSSSALFSVARLGWHAQFAPSVVLVSADKFAGQPDDAGFSPALAWMLRYTPRPDQTGFWNDFSRWTRWGVGPHAALLNFDPDNDTEIGLGLTVGLWGEILQFGAGYNLMADASDEAQVYYYVGSSLIPMLQALDAD